MAAQKKDGLTAALEQMPSGIYLPPNARKSAMRVIVDATAFADDQIDQLVEQFALMQLHFPYVKPIFLISAMAPGALSAAGFMYETVTPEATWRDLAAPGTYREYKERRVVEMLNTYQANRVHVQEPSSRIPRWLYER